MGVAPLSLGGEGGRVQRGGNVSTSPVGPYTVKAKIKRDKTFLSDLESHGSERKIQLRID